MGSMGIGTHLIGEADFYRVSHHFLVRVRFSVVRLVDSGKVVIKRVSVLLHLIQQQLPVDGVADAVGLLELVYQVDVADFFRGQFSVRGCQGFFDRCFVKCVKCFVAYFCAFLRERFAVQVDTEVLFRSELHEMHAQDRVRDCLGIFFQKGTCFRFLSFEVVQLKTGVDFMMP